MYACMILYVHEAYSSFSQDRTGQEAAVAVGKDGRSGSGTHPPGDRSLPNNEEEGPEMTKRAALYCRVSTGDQHPETQLLDLREFAKQRGLQVAHEYSDVISGAKTKRPGLDRLLADAQRHRFDTVIVAAFDRIARNVRHFLEVLDELNHLSIEFISLRENIDTSGPLGRAIVVIVGAIAELEKSLIVERVRAGMR